MTKNALLRLPILLLIADPGQSQDVKDFQWLVGTWKILDTNPDKNSYQVWKDVGHNTLAGISYNVKNADTLLTEEIKPSRKGGCLYDTPDVAGPQEEVRFKITSYDANDRVTKQEEERLEATIEGGGKSIYYTFVRVK